jgi:DNA repair protein RecN (Recombination protein N)
MLKTLHLQNIALITELEIEFGKGLNVLTGETGAGKSIIIGGLNFILGGKLDKTIIRQGASFARADTVFQVYGQERNEITEISGIDFDSDEVILSRTLKADGKSDCRINGAAVTLETLRAASNILINIHGQHETEALLKPKNHVAILDSFGGGQTKSALSNYNEALIELNDAKRKLREVGGDENERKRMIDMYEYQIRDIEGSKLKRGEDIDLQEQKSRMQNFEKIKNSLSLAANAKNTPAEIVSALLQISSIDTRAERFYETARTLSLEFDDLQSDIASYFESLDFDEDEFARIDARLDEIKILKRKYGNTITDILNFLNQAHTNLELLINGEKIAAEAAQKVAEWEQAVSDAAENLVAARTQAARNLEDKIQSHLQDLGMPSAVFIVNEITATSVNFLFSANAGIAPRPLSHIISGGEMSRFMLALKAVTASMESIGTLVFDEIDTGISGIMGHKIAQKIEAICRFTQVIAVTHLAQIAAAANQHFKIEKEDGKTPDVTLLTDAQRKTELTRMLGGEAMLTKVQF